MESKPMREIITKRFKQISSRSHTRLTTDILFDRGDTDGSVRMVLKPRAIGAARNGNLNMQEAPAAFEAWALLIHAHCGFSVQLDIEEASSPAPPVRSHYGRFLYRAMKFAEQYGTWFSLSERLKEPVADFARYLYQMDASAGAKQNFCNGLPTKEPTNSTYLENRVEELFASSAQPVLSAITLREAGLTIAPAGIWRQLPVGLYEKEKREATSVFTYGKSAVDLWALAGDSMVIYELKVRNPMVGILTELMFYANYAYDMYVAENRFYPMAPPNGTGNKELRGYPELYERRGSLRMIHGAMLTDQLHPLITPKVVDLMNEGSPFIRYHDLRYTLSIDVGDSV